MTVTDHSGGSKEMGAFFDDNHDGIKDPGEDVMLGFASPFSFGADYYYSTAGASGATHYADTGTDGTNPPGDGTDDIVGAGQVVGSQVTFEIRHPLCSDDTAHDFCLTPGDTVGVDLMYVIDGTGFMYPGADAFAPSDWADLTLSAAPAPAGRIVFESNRDGNLEIYRMNADGSAPTRLTNDPATDNLPSISPDGTKVAFSSDRAGTPDIWVMNIDGTGLTQLTSDAGLEQQPAWSPDGTKIAYQGSVIEQYDIFVVDATGGTPVDVTNTAANEASPSWSPDGTQLAFMSDRDGNEEVYRQNADGTGSATRLTNNARSRLGSGLVTRRAEDRLLQRPRREPCCGTVWTINASDGSDQVNLTNAIIFDADPSWSPDGTRIAFVRDAGGQNFEVWTALADGTDQVNLTRIGGRNSFPDWGPTPSSLTASISIAAPESSDPGAASAPIDGIPLDAIRGESQTTAGAPLGGIPLGGIPLGGIPLGGIPLGGIPLGGIGFTAENLSQNGLGGVPLSTIPLVLPDTWEAHLALDPAFKGTPPQNVTLAQVLGTPVVAGITLDKLNLASSPLGGIPLAGIALGGLPLGGIPLGGIAGTPPDQNLDRLVPLREPAAGLHLPGRPKPRPTDDARARAPGCAAGRHPARGHSARRHSSRRHPARRDPRRHAARRHPAGRHQPRGTPLGGIPLGGIDMSPNALRSAASRSARSRQREARDLRLPDRQLPVRGHGHARPGQGGRRDQADREAAGPRLLQGRERSGHHAQGPRARPAARHDARGSARHRPPEDRLRLGAAAAPGFPLQDFSPDGGTATYTVSFQLDGAGPPVDGSIAVHLRADARYVTGSTHALGRTRAVVGRADAESPENELNWHLTNVRSARATSSPSTRSPASAWEPSRRPRKSAATGLDGTVHAPEAASTQITEPGEPANGQPELAQPAQPDTLYLGYTSSGSDRDYFQVHADPGRAADDPPQPPEGRRRSRHLRAGHRAAADAAPRRRGARRGRRAVRSRPAHAVDHTRGAHRRASGRRRRPDRPRRLGQPRPRRRGSVRGLTRGRDVHDPGRELRRRLQQRSVGAADREIALDRAAAHVHQPAGPRHAASTKAMPAVPTTASTLYLFASKRFGDLYGLQAENDVFSRLQTLAARTDAAGGAVIPVDANAAVLNALNARAADSCSPAKANDVVRAVGNLLDNPLIVRPSVKYIVVVGDDAAGIPFGRVLDNSAYANERGYASTFFGATNNQYLSTYGLGFLPTDDPLGDVNYSGQGPYVPELAVGRLVETPTQILSQITQYINRNGAINPTRALTTGYDFLSDGASRVSADFKARLGTNNAQELINNSWSKNNLLAAMFPTSNPPILDSINAHYDHAAPCRPTRTPRSASRSSTRPPISRAARRAGGSSSRWAATRPCRYRTSSSAARSAPTGRRRTRRAERWSTWAIRATGSATPRRCSTRRS